MLQVLACQQAGSPYPFPLSEQSYVAEARLSDKLNASVGGEAAKVCLSSRYYNSLKRAIRPDKHEGFPSAFQVTLRFCPASLKADIFIQFDNTQK